MRIFANSKEKEIFEKIYQDKEINKIFKKLYGWMFVLSIIVLYYAIPEMMEMFKNNTDWLDKLIPTVFAIFGIINLVDCIINIAKIKANERKERKIK